MLYLGADHGGFKLKEFLKKYFDSKKIKYKDLGTYSEEPVDYPDIAFKVAKKVAKERARGVLICGTGVGVCIAANRIKGIRAALAYDEEYAKLSRIHNDSNIICLRGWDVDFKKQAKLIDIWIKTKFDNIPRRRKRNAKLR